MRFHPMSLQPIAIRHFLTLLEDRLVISSEIHDCAVHIFIAIRQITTRCIAKEMLTNALIALCNVHIDHASYEWILLVIRIAIVVVLDFIRSTNLR